MPRRQWWRGNSVSITKLPPMVARRWKIPRTNCENLLPRFWKNALAVGIHPEKTQPVTEQNEKRDFDTSNTEIRRLSMQLITVKIDKPEDINFVLGQTHFIKSVEDIHEALVGAVPGIKFGLAFCEASGKCLVRWSGTDPAMTELAKKNAAAIGAGHSFIVFLGDGFFPLNVLNTLKMVPEVCRIFCTSANPTEVILAEMEQGRGILGVVDGFSPKGVEDEGEIKWRKEFLRKIGYKL